MTNFTELWYQAVGQPVGIVVRSNNVEGLRQKLYAARKETRDPDLDGFSLVISPVDATQLWILRKRIEDETL